MKDYKSKYAPLFETTRKRNMQPFIRKSEKLATCDSLTQKPQNFLVVSASATTKPEV